jgi:hypothetical protein
MAKLFTHAEAESLIPQVDRLLRDAIAAKSDYAEADRAIQRFTERVMVMGGMVVDRDQALEARGRRDELSARLRQAIESIQEIGCLVKDLDTGLVDFPTMFQDREVYLCWKLGESGISFWHEVEAGFRGRKPIDREFLENHRGDRAH